MIDTLKVLEFATKAHAGQKRRVYGRDFINHSIAVSNSVVRNLEGEIDIYRTVGLLHDVVEDTTITIEDITKFLTSIGIEDNASIQIIEAVRLLTKPKERPPGYSLFINYLVPIKANTIARKVKLADLDDNMHGVDGLVKQIVDGINVEKAQKKLDKYRLIAFFLAV